ncbi:MAG: glycerate kinase [Promethearchaeota archaeon]
MIRNFSKLIKGTPRNQQARKLVLDLFLKALEAVNPHLLIQRALQLKNSILHCANTKVELSDINGIFLIGAGKATGRMAEATEALLAKHIVDGLIIVPESTIKDYSLRKVQIHGGGHPKPNNASLRASQLLLEFVERIPPDSLLISLFSGGGSTLLTLPSPPLTLKDIQQTTQVLSKTGIAINEMNTVRKHLSQVKGGQLVAHIHPRRHLGLLLSDVPKDHLHLIASGPTLPDPTTFSDVAQIFDTYQLWQRVPSRVRDYITAGIEGSVPDTPKPDDPIFRNSLHHLIGSNYDACHAVLRQAQKKRVQARILTTDCQGEAREIGKKLGRLAITLVKNNDPQIIIVGSETTVMIRHPGKGGRNTELLAAILPYLQNHEGLVVGSLATDGIDGPTDAAGAIADNTSYHRAQAHQLSPAHLLDTNNTYTLFHALEDLIITGPTQTNVRDITIFYWHGSVH